MERGVSRSTQDFSGELHMALSSVLNIPVADWPKDVSTWKTKEEFKNTLNQVTDSAPNLDTEELFSKFKKGCSELMTKNVFTDHELIQIFNTLNTRYSELK